MNGAYTYDLMKFKGGYTVGTDYVSRVFRARSHEIEEKYASALESTRNPSLLTMIQDNWLRIFGLNAFERLVTAYQAYPSLNQRFYSPGTFSHTFTEIMNEGVFRGALKGISLNLLQFSAVLFPAVYLTSKTSPENRFSKFVLNYTLFDTLLYPLDTMKSILWADTLGKMRLSSLLSQVSFNQYYSGYVYKMLYNLPVLSGIFHTSQVGSENEAMLSWAVAALLYPINTNKVCQQVSASPLSSMDMTSTVRQGYRGVVPYLLINALVGYSLRPLFSKEKLQQIRE